jgi:hypothetical protein
VEAKPEDTGESVLVDDVTSQVVVIDGDEMQAISNDPQTQAPSSFLEHLERLPKDFPHCSLCFSPEELTRIEGTNCHGFTTRMKQQIESDYSKLAHILTMYNNIPDRITRCVSCQSRVDEMCWCHIFDPKRAFQLEDYKWALCNVYSRSTDFERSAYSEEARHRRVIAPLFDMMNHSFTSDVSHAMDNEGNLSVYNGSNIIEPMDEIFLNYGNFPNEKLLLVYGFCIPQNPFDAVEIYAPISPGDPLYQVKARMLATRCGIEDVNIPHPLKRGTGDIVIPSSLLAVLRLVGVQSMEEIMMIARQEESNIGMISSENEVSALQALQQALHAMARQLALNMISDEGLHGASSGIDSVKAKATDGIRITEKEKEPTKANNVEANTRNAKILCQSEYSILQAAMEELSERLKILEEGIADID